MRGFGESTATRRGSRRTSVLRDSALVIALVAALATTALIAAACGAQQPATSTSGAGVTSTSVGDVTSTSGSANSLPTAGRPVNFTTEDGVTLGGNVFGSGDQGVILAHMYPADQTSWFPTAERLAKEGFLVLTFDFRGYGESGGQKQIDLVDRDVTAAIIKIREEGASEVVLAGASMGGTASLIAGDRAQLLSSIRMAGIATLSAPVEFRGLSAADAVPRIVVPLLFVAAENDAGAAGARQLEELSSGKGDLQIVPGSDHGTDLLAGEHGAQVYELLLDFIKSSLAP